MRRWCIAGTACCVTLWMGTGLGLRWGDGRLGNGSPGASAATTSPADSSARKALSPPSTEPAVRTPRPAVSPPDWESVVRFMRKNSPARLGFIRSLPEGPRRATMSAAAVQDYRIFQRALKDPELSQTILVRLKLEDDLFSLAAELRQAPLEQQPALIDQVHLKVGQLIDSTFQERQQRIDRLKRVLENQEKNLAADMARRDEIVSQRMKEVMRSTRFATTHPSTQPLSSTRPVGR